VYFSDERAICSCQQRQTYWYATKQQHAAMMLMHCHVYRKIPASLQIIMLLTAAIYCKIKNCCWLYPALDWTFSLSSFFLGSTSFQLRVGSHSKKLTNPWARTRGQQRIVEVYLILQNHIRVQGSSCQNRKQTTVSNSWEPANKINSAYIGIHVYICLTWTQWTNGHVLRNQAS